MYRKPYLFGAFALLLSLSSASTALATPIGHVSGPDVTEGRTQFEMRFGYTVDDDSASLDDRRYLRQQIDYGLSDWHAIRLITVQDKRVGASLRARNIAIENRFQIVEKRDAGWAAGIGVIFGLALDGRSANSTQMRFVSDIPLAGSWGFRHNTTLKYFTGGSSSNGLGLELRHSLMRAFSGSYGSIHNLKLGARILI